MVEALFLSKKIVNPFWVRVTINEKRALFWSKMYPLSGQRLGVGSFFTVKWWDFTNNKKRYIVSILNKKRGP